MIATGFVVLFIKSCETKSQELITHKKLLTAAPWKSTDTAGRVHVFTENEDGWSMSADGKILYIIEPGQLGGAAFPYEVETLNAHTLRLKRISGTFVFTETYSH